MLLPGDQQVILWEGRHKAVCWKQHYHWETSRSISAQDVLAVYTQLYGETRAQNMASIISRKAKEAEMDARLGDA